MKISVVTLFLKTFESYFAHSMMWKAQDKKLLEIDYVDLRDFGIGPRKQVDDTPYGGGDGMLLRADVVVPAIESVRTKESRVILLTPQGEVFKQADAQRLFEIEHLILVCGHYEGFDERIREHVDEQISVGDYVLTGGELPAMVVMDAVARLIPGVLGGEASAEVESFADGELLEYPQYTRPEDFQGKKVPDILLSGHHGEIAKWRTDQAQRKTKRRYTK
jgi:tRNA (guanine37-N1)-methyltransferase